MKSFYSYGSDKPCYWKTDKSVSKDLFSSLTYSKFYRNEAHNPLGSNNHFLKIITFSHTKVIYVLFRTLFPYMIKNND